MRNEQASVEETLGSLTGQDYAREQVEILVADGRSSDGSRDIVARAAAEHPNIRLLDNPRLTSAAGRNVGIRAARGRFIAIVDCHSFVRPDFLTIAARAFEETGADCLGRPVELFLPGDSYIQRVIGAARTSWLGHNPVSPRYSRRRGPTSPLSVAIVYSRAVFDRIGLFDEEFGACEDVEFNSRLQRAGMSTWTEPALLCYYHPRRSLWGLFKQIKGYAYWRCRLVRGRGTQAGGRRAITFRLSQALPAAAVVVGAALITAAAWRAVVLAPLVIAYAAAVGIASAQAARRRGLRYLPLLPLAFLVIHLGVVAGWCAGALGHRPRPASGAPPAEDARGAVSWAAGYARSRAASHGLAAGGLRIRTAAALEALRARFAAGRPIRLLDIGTADGEMLGALGREIEQLSAVGMDTSFDLLTAARAPAAMVQARATRLPFKDGCFDACLMAAVLKHVKDAPAALAEAARVVRPDGAVILIEPSTLAIRMACLLGYLDRSSLAHRFTVGALERMARGAGLKLVGVRFLVMRTRWPRLDSIVHGAIRLLRLSPFVPLWMALAFEPQAQARPAQADESSGRPDCLGAREPAGLSS
jgi:GT2 family glycosyltransferase/SAM-dependent methyltransferase